MNSKYEKLYVLFIALLAWFAVLTQLYLMLAKTKDGFLTAFIRFLSYFTILTNLIVAVCFSIKAFIKTVPASNFFSKPQTLTAVTVYILIVGIVYNVLLRHVWNPVGLQKFIDEVLHSATPVLCLLYWFIFVPKAQLQWRHTSSWLLYPLIYSIYSFVRGEISNEYPYYFIDVSKIGYQQVLINTGLLFLAFFILSMLMIGVGKFFMRWVHTKKNVSP